MAKNIQTNWYPIISEYFMRAAYGDVYFQVNCWLRDHVKRNAKTTYAPSAKWAGCVTCNTFIKGKPSEEIFRLDAPRDFPPQRTRKAFGDIALAEAKKHFEANHKFAGPQQDKPKPKPTPKPKASRKANGQAQATA